MIREPSSIGRRSGNPSPSAFMDLTHACPTDARYRPRLVLSPSRARSVLSQVTTNCLRWLCMPISPNGRSRYRSCTFEKQKSRPLTFRCSFIVSRRSCARVDSSCFLICSRTQARPLRFLLSFDAKGRFRRRIRNISRKPALI